MTLPLAPYTVIDLTRARVSKSHLAEDGNRS